MVMASADLTMDVDVPMADPVQLSQAVWWMHHVRHNADRVLEAESVDRQAVAAKRELLDHMDDDRDPVRRAAAFGQIHEINRRLIDAVPHLLIEARAQLDRVRTGMANGRVATKRDWCFGLYEPGRLQKMAAGLGSESNTTGHAAKM